MDRTIHGITWHDDLAWMESMKGARWNSVLKKEQALSKELSAAHEVELISAELNAALAPYEAFAFKSGGVLVAINGSSYLWKAIGSAEPAIDLVANDTHIWVVKDTTEGALEYAIVYQTIGGKRIWEHRGVGPYVAIIDGRCYCLEVKKQLVYYRLVSWNAYTGKDRRVHYEEKDYTYNLELIRGNGCAFLRRQAGTRQNLFSISKSGVALLDASDEPRRFIPGSADGEYLVWSGVWSASPALCGWNFPSWAQAVPEILDTERGLLVTRWKGCRTLWSIGRKTPKKLWTGIGTFRLDPWDGDYILLSQPGVNPIWFSCTKVSSLQEGLTETKVAKSADGTDIPFLLLGSTKPRGLLVVGYGAYGMSTVLSTARWKPLLARGWALAIGLWRGGGDHTPEWEDAGRLEGRVKVLEDASAVVRKAQKLCGLGADKTVLYGRSAGGLWVGGLCARYPDGSLAGGAYMEVPYLDVLRTTTNRALPLTDIEADEFGLPERSIHDLSSILSWSPMDTLPPGGTPGIWQLVRTGLNDPQVFAYESVKWVERCRGGRGKIILAIEGGQGHFVEGETGIKQRAQDICFLLKQII